MELVWSPRAKRRRDHLDPQLQASHPRSALAV